MTELQTLQDRYTTVRQRIAQAAKRSGRSPESVVLVAVTKSAEPDQIRELINMGHVDLGENRVQQLIQRATIIDEWLARRRSMPGIAPQAPSDGPLGIHKSPTKPSGSASTVPTPSAPLVRWHMIGHLQRNKARKAVELCRLVHSVDSLRLAEELQLIGLKREQPIEVLLQVNCSGEEQKYGCAIAAVQHLAEQFDSMMYVQLRGIMTMAAHTADPQQTRATFARCRELFEEVRESGAVGPKFNILSMGMSNDFEVAIEEGSNLVRVGSALFGDPKPGQSDPVDEDED